jgi:hypothetical protein
MATARLVSDSLGDRNMFQDRVSAYLCHERLHVASRKLDTLGNMLYKYVDLFVHALLAGQLLLGEPDDALEKFRKNQVAVDAKLRDIRAAREVDGLHTVLVGQSEDVLHLGHGAVRAPDVLAEHLELLQVHRVEAVNLPHKHALRIPHAR